MSVRSHPRYRAALDAYLKATEDVEADPDEQFVRVVRLAFHLQSVELDLLGRAEEVEQ